jgi:CheY-like chemotaxis protein
MSSRILVVDDDDCTRDVLARLLVAEGHTADTCETGREALERLGAAPYDVLLTDLVMDGMSGLELTSSARALYPDLRCVVMSGHPRAPEASDAVGWVTKPIDIDVLLAALT